MVADLEKLHRVLRGESDGYSMDKRFIRKDGSILYVSMSVGCVRRDDGSVDYFIALLKDISARMSALQELRHQNKLVVPPNPTAGPKPG